MCVFEGIIMQLFISLFCKEFLQKSEYAAGQNQDEGEDEEKNIDEVLDKYWYIKHFYLI